MAYTKKQLDEATAAIAGPGDRTYANRNSLLDLTAVAGIAWAHRRPEDEHSAVLREAILDRLEAGRLLAAIAR